MSDIVSDHINPVAKSSSELYQDEDGWSVGVICCLLKQMLAAGAHENHSHICILFCIEMRREEQWPDECAILAAAATFTALVASIHPRLLRLSLLRYHTYLIEIYWKRSSGLTIPTVQFSNAVLTEVLELMHPRRIS